ncbi:hypothetical protein NPIL_378261 [Nephila pilipes]|uniref:Uncharacterized protein n=1 Tax=Nephila pilipes TaxID=299642 RepID=A0A8X6QNK1_NEPPI|nr:hypothetical protein NPIL_378261 [Nephila pilipes]
MGEREEPSSAEDFLTKSGIICMTDYQRVELNEASGSNNMATEESPSALNSTNGVSKADGNQEKGFPGSKRNFWQRRSKMEKILLASTIVLLLLVLILFVVSIVQIHDTAGKMKQHLSGTEIRRIKKRSDDVTIQQKEAFDKFKSGQSGHDNSSIGGDCLRLLALQRKELLEAENKGLEKSNNDEKDEDPVNCQSGENPDIRCNTKL